MQSRQARIHAAWAAASLTKHSSIQRSHASTQERQDDELVVVSDILLSFL